MVCLLWECLRCCHTLHLPWKGQEEILSATAALGFPARECAEIAGLCLGNDLMSGARLETESNEA